VKRHIKIPQAAEHTSVATPHKTIRSLQEQERPLSVQTNRLCDMSAEERRRRRRRLRRDHQCR
jgi:hypothetical protein